MATELGNSAFTERDAPLHFRHFGGSVRGSRAHDSRAGGYASGVNRAEAARWLELLDRDGLLLLVADGPYVRYGMPVHVTVRREREVYRIDLVEESDGVGVPPCSSETIDRAELLPFLERLAADGRPLRRLGG